MRGSQRMNGMSGSLLMAGETVAVFMSGDDARVEQQLSIAIFSYTTCIRYRHAVTVKD